jgi:type II secretory ATPase GspE/PulE/Tfp pilus assembly ATPase PilB-like protein
MLTPLMENVEYVDLLDYNQLPYLGELIANYSEGVSWSLPSKSDAKHPFALLLLLTIAYAVREAASDIHLEFHPRWGYKLNVSTMHGDVHIHTSHLRVDDAKTLKNLIPTRCGIPVGSQERSDFNAAIPVDFPMQWIFESGIPVKPCFAKASHYHLRLRVAYIQMTDGGYSFTFRLIDENRTKALEEMGFSYSVLCEISKISTLKSGLVLFAGPTGSGKSSTQYACLSKANVGQKKIITIEDPVEFMLDGPGSLVQIEVTPDLPPERALQQTLRMAAKILMIGEIRSPEMLQIALAATTTGHLVFATVHADNVPGAVARLFKLLPEGMREAELATLANALRAVICQRLVPLRNPIHKSAEPSINQHEWILKNSGVDLGRYTLASHAVVDRQAMVEMLVVDYDVKLAIEAMEIERVFELAGKQAQFETLLQQGLRFVEKGLVALDDCEQWLGGQPMARRYPTLRINLAKKYNLTMNQVNETIDTYYSRRKKGEDVSLEEMCREYAISQNRIDSDEAIRA